MQFSVVIFCKTNKINNSEYNVIGGWKGTHIEALDGTQKRWKSNNDELKANK